MAGQEVTPPHTCPNPMMIPMLGPCGLGGGSRGMHAQGDILQGLGPGGEALALAGKVVEEQAQLSVWIPGTLPLLHGASSRYRLPTAAQEQEAGPDRELRAWA